MPVNRQGGTRLIVLSAILIVGLAVALWFWLQPGTRPTLDAGRDVVAAFLENLREGQPDLAWESTTADFKSDQGKESFVRAMKKRPELKESMAYVYVQEVNLQDHPRSEYVFRSADNHQVRVLIGREGGAWKVDRLSR